MSCEIPPEPSGQSCASRSLPIELVRSPLARLPVAPGTSSTTVVRLTAGAAVGYLTQRNVGPISVTAQSSPEKLKEAIKAINDIISKYADDKKVYYKDIGDKFLNKDGGLEKKVMPDLLHLNEASYTTWAESIEPKLKELLGEK